MNGDDKTVIETLLSIAAACFAAGFWIRRRECTPLAWPQTTGVIITSKTIRQYGYRGGEDVLPVIEYEFDYQGRSFRSSHWRLGNYSFGNSASADAVISRYPVGSSVTVFVNPRKPMKSVLESSVSSLCWLPFGAGIFFLSISILAILLITQK